MASSTFCTLCLNTDQPRSVSACHRSASFIIMFIFVFPFVFVLVLVFVFAPEHWTASICICLSPVPRLITKREKGRKPEKPLPVDDDREARIIPSHFKDCQVNSIINGCKSKSVNTWFYCSFKRRNLWTVEEEIDFLTVRNPCNCNLKR